ncbi:RNA methyltransferase tRNA(m5U54)methyltransferase [Coemansia sp. RSA 1813]|nr:RNA methyltransferase tRNA(m5U54)methyltransferase [Coemansia sp. RSA 1646]KAJ1771606.1 RNA methyltransferase tRNA(m5U54)methyltransferase [Coemansia sp. RSA 1843]KAJ2089910.1 RNA methyltransferase tRNA(m5U54)methyltransferase [Coemansia sp. RSA 986]KAJ2215226.1 RNA methyltransferase tRNA(m5U54)methyltransferase [Coemansia sp. RSA 487]KAJ2571020.1 RNA methyltransferase tRNA(m5U54)methyltransferase [Coemansia sp. RSA 1813]
MADEHAPAYDVSDYNEITEGKATILFPKNNEVFYNPVQEFNRDMSIAAIKTWRDITMEARMARFDKSTNPNKVSPPTTFTVLEALAASGLRSVRYAKEIEGIDHIVTNDLLEDAVESIRRNAHFNGISQSLVRANQGDAISVMYSYRDKERFDVVDLDPYGTAAPFIDGAIHAVKKNGLICVTCTDLAVLASNNHPETCFVKYGGNPLKAEFCHELALRLVIHSLQQAASRQKRYIEPLLSCSIDFYVRIFVRVHDKPLLTKTVSSQTGVVYHCKHCGSFASQSFGSIEEGKNNNHKYHIPDAPIVDQKCANCGSKQQIGGPCWLGPLHNKDFVQRMYDNVSKTDKSVYGTHARMKGMLKVILEELNDVPFHYELSEICSAVRSPCPPLVKFNAAILNAGYRVSGSHTRQGSIKTDAPSQVIWDIMRTIVKETGRSTKITKDSPADIILSKDVQTDVSFALHKDANPESRRIKLVRYQINPEKFWGPKARHTEAPKNKKPKLE